MTVKKRDKNQKYLFIAIVFLVLTLSCLSLFTFFNHKNASKLNKTVNGLSATHENMDKIDQAIQLLYIAENNSRMYVVYRDINYFNLFNEQLKSVSSLLDSISTDTQNTNNLNELIKDKQAKTKLFTQAKLLLDSLLMKGGLQTVEAPEVKTTIFKPQNTHKITVDTTVGNNVIAKKNKSGLFKRLKEAIVNKADSVKVNNVTISRAAQDAIILSKQKELNRQTVYLQNQSEALAKLKQKEKEVLAANHALFDNLHNILTDFKGQERSIVNKRKSILGKDASLLANNLETNNVFLIVFGLVLTLMILLFLRRLYYNDKALKKAKEEAETYARLKSEFVETMSHEIRTPLHSIQVFSDELSTHKSVQNQAEVVDAIKLSSHMLLSVVNNILDYSKMEKGKFVLASIPFNPYAVILETLEGMQLQAKRKGIRLVHKIENSLNVLLVGDAFQLRQLLINLLSNAIKYTDEGEIVIEASLTKKEGQNRNLNLWIKDTGIGIEDKKSAHLFEAYVTAAHQREIKEGSTGLGLSIVKKIVDLHKGAVNVSSQLGKGTTFEVVLPYQCLDKKMPDRESPQVKIEILVVDDDSLNLAYFKLSFDESKYHFSTASNGKEALKLIDENQFQLILTDLSMPEMDGITLAKNIRALKDTRKSTTPIIAITGHIIKAQEQEKQKGLINDWLVKPYNVDVLEQLINKVIQNRHR